MPIDSEKQLSFQLARVEPHQVDQAIPRQNESSKETETSADNVVSISERLIENEEKEIARLYRNILTRTKRLPE